MKPLGLPQDVTPVTSGIPSKRVSVSFTSSSFLDRESIARIAAESLRTARDVGSYAAAGDVRSVDIAALEVTQYSPSAGQSAPEFFTENRVDDPVNVRRRSDGVVVPHIDSVEVVFSPGHGVIDGFSTKISVSLPTAGVSSIRAISLMRRDIGIDSGSVKMSRFGLGRIATFTDNRNGKDSLSDIEANAIERGLGDRILQDNPTDIFLNTRRSSVKTTVRLASSLSEVQRSLSISSLDGIVSAASASKIDAGLVYDLNTITRIRDVFPTGSRSVVVRRTDTKPSTQPTDSGFKQIVLSGLPKLNEHGGASSFFLVDDSVLRGSRYGYYVSFIGENGRQVGRTEMVEATVDVQNTTPKEPSVYPTTDGKSVTLRIATDKSVESVEVFRGSADGWKLISTQICTRGETIVFDRTVRPAGSYVYRIYVVDHFGNKSQTPAVCRVDVPTNFSSELPSLVVDGDVDGLSGFAFVDVFIDDPDMSGFFVSRRDITLNDRMYYSSGAPSVISIGVLDGRRSHTVSSFDPSYRPNGFVPVSGVGRYRFTDYESRVDHTYQYCVYGVNIRGKKTSSSHTKTVFVSKRPMVSTPLSLTASVSDGEVSLSWSEANLTVSAADMLGDRDELKATSVRNIYQLQRMDKGVGVWENFPIMDTTSALDSAKNVSDGRPAAPIPGRTYMYRVATFQTGGYYSNYTDPIETRVDPVIPSVGVLNIRNSDPRVSPFCVTVGWESDGFEGYWEVSRVAMNNAAATSVTTISTVSELPFEVVSKISRESSRANPVSIDAGRKRGEIFSSKRFYVDSDVEDGNTYFYRVIAIGEHTKSDPSYGAIAVNRSRVKLDNRMLAGTKLPVTRKII